VRVVRLLVWAAGAALCVGTELALYHVDQPTKVQHRGIVESGLTLVVITAGVLVWERRPENRTGILLIALGFASTFGEWNWIFWNHALPVTIAFATMELYVPLFAHAVLSYPTGRLATRLERRFVAFGYVFATAYSLPLLFFFDPSSPHDPNLWECRSCALPLTHITWYDVTGIRSVLDWLLLPLALAFLVVLVRKVIRSGPGGRRIFLPLGIAAFFSAAEFSVQIVLYGSPASSMTNTSWFWISNIAVLTWPVALAVGVLLSRRSRSAVADLVVELERTPPVSVRDALAKALGDPSLELALWLPERAAYVDTGGRSIALPRPGDDRAVTVLGPSDAPVAALVHDPVLLERAGLLEASAAAARLALENERLQAELRAQLAELRASRARIVQAADDERRRIERNLHDGAQQRLLGLGLALQLARDRLGAREDGAAELLAEAESELRDALDDLRELARGIHPAILTDGGLAPALRALAERSAVPVTLVEVPADRPAEPVEAAAYFLVAESLANCAKYAQASGVHVRVTRHDATVVVDVDDDGVGGADPAHGSGLRGLSDRVHALDGSMRVDSPSGRGTHIHAEIPCAW
jgi:signal transduction histidine kinase